MLLAFCLGLVCVCVSCTEIHGFKKKILLLLQQSCTCCSIIELLSSSPGETREESRRPPHHHLCTHHCPFHRLLTADLSHPYFRWTAAGDECRAASLAHAAPSGLQKHGSGPYCLFMAVMGLLTSCSRDLKRGSVMSTFIHWLIMQFTI